MKDEHLRPDWIDELHVQENRELWDVLSGWVRDGQIVQAAGHHTDYASINDHISETEGGVLKCS